MTRGVDEPSYQKRPAYHSTLLGGMALFASTLLVMGDIETADDIQQRVLEDKKRSLSQVVPGSLYDNDLNTNILHIVDGEAEVTVYRATLKGRVTAVAFEVTGQGYAGPIKAIMALDQDGNVLGVRIVSHTETPGLGDKIEARKSDWILEFSGLSFTKIPEAMWKVKKDRGHFDQFTGATITPRAVVAAVKSGLSFFKKFQMQLLAHAQTSPKEQTLTTVEESDNAGED